MRRRAHILVVTIAAIVACPAFGQSCEKPSGAIQYNEKFVLGQLRMMSETDTASQSGELFGIGKENLDLKHLRTESDKLNIDTARSYIQEAYASMRENIVAECGYRLCLLQNGQKSFDSTAVTLYAEVCRASLGSAGTPSEIDRLSLKPSMPGVIFADKNSPAQTKRIELFNTGDAAEKLRVVTDRTFLKLTPLSGKLGADGTFSLPGHDSAVFDLTVQNPRLPEEITRGTVRFQVVSNPQRMASAIVTVVSGATALAPPASIGMGTLTPNAEADWDTDHSDLNPFKETKVGPFTLPVLLTAAQGSFKYGDNGYAGFSANAKTTEAAGRASSKVSIATHYGGKCGQGSSGGGGRIAPRWDSTLFLPPTPKGKVWSVRVLSVATAKSDQNLFQTNQIPGGQCDLTIGTWTEKLAIPGTDNHAKTEMEPGTYSITIDCPQTASSCRGRYKGMIENYVTYTYDFTIEANRTDAEKTKAKTVAAPTTR
jgi:hypothetical protein